MGVEFHANSEPFFLGYSKQGEAQTLANLSLSLDHLYPSFFSSDLWLLVWSFLEMHNFGFLSKFMNHWGYYGNADSDLIGPGCGQSLDVSPTCRQCPCSGPYMTHAGSSKLYQCPALAHERCFLKKKNIEYLLIAKLLSQMLQYNLQKDPKEINILTSILQVNKTGPEKTTCQLRGRGGGVPAPSSKSKSCLTGLPLI